MGQKKVISKVKYMRYKKDLDALNVLGYRYDMAVKARDLKKAAELKEMIIRRCDELRPKLGLKDISDEEAEALLGRSFGTTQQSETSVFKDAGVREDTEGQCADQIDSGHVSGARDGA